VVLTWSQVSRFSGHPSFFYGWYQFIPYLRTADCWAHGRFQCPPPHTDITLSALEFLRTQVPPGTRVLPLLAPEGKPLYVDAQPDFASAVRYYGRLPVVFSYSDVAILMTYGNSEKLAHQLETAEKARQVHRMKPGPEKVDAMFRLARDLGAGVVVVDFPLSREEIAGRARILFRNAKFTIFAVQDRPGIARSTGLVDE